MTTVRQLLDQLGLTKIGANGGVIDHDESIRAALTELVQRRAADTPPETAP